MALKRGTPIDQNLVEQVKVLRSQKRSQAQVARDLNISVCTVRRYERREDETPEQQEARIQNLVLSIDKAWRTIHVLEDQNYKDATEGNLSAKDAFVAKAIEIDKVAAMERQLATGDSTESQVKTTFVLQLADSGEVKSDATELPLQSGEVPGDGVRIGSGENLLGLPGSCEAEPFSKDLGCCGGVDVQEHEGLRPPDDNGRTLDGPGDS